MPRRRERRVLRRKGKRETYLMHTVLAHRAVKVMQKKNIPHKRVEGQTILTNGVANGELRNGWGILEL